MKEASKNIVLSGLKPSGVLHVGNYLGMMHQSIELQNDPHNSCYYFIADYHALTQKYDPAEKSKEIMDMGIDALAMGLDPEKSVLFMQSDILEHANLAWLLSCVTPAGQLQGMIEFREKVEQGQSATAGLLNYPVLMAADILSYKASAVPVGEDQRQHLELARDIARNFNKRFGYLFPEPKGIFVEGLRIMSLDDPSKKMSKSLPKGCIYLNDTPEVINKKIGTAITDSGSEIKYSPADKPAIANLLMIYSGMTGRTVKDIASEHADSNYSQFKKKMAEDIAASLAPFRERRAQLSADPKAVRKILDAGAEKARHLASKTLSEAKSLMGLI